MGKDLRVRFLGQLCFCKEAQNMMILAVSKTE